MKHMDDAIEWVATLGRAVDPDEQEHLSELWRFDAEQQGYEVVSGPEFTADEGIPGLSGPVTYLKGWVRPAG